MENRKIEFNDEFVAARIPQLLALEIGATYISGDKVKAVEKILELKNNTISQLQAKRNSVVKLIAIEHCDEAAWNTMSGVTAVIDKWLMQAYIG